MISISAKIQYADRVVLDVDNLQFDDGKRYAIIGANGSGKSTLLKLLDKQIRLNKDGARKVEKDCIVGYMPQQSIAFDMSVLKNVLIANRMLNRKLAKKCALDYINALDLSKLKRKNASRLSGGESQRVALARTLMMRSNVILLDEPTAALDVEQAKAVIALLKSETEYYKSTLIFATHSLKQAQELADKIIFLCDGKVEEICDAYSFLTTKHCQKLEEFINAIM